MDKLNERNRSMYSKELLNAVISSRTPGDLVRAFCVDKKPRSTKENIAILRYVTGEVHSEFINDFSELNIDEEYQDAVCCFLRGDWR